MRFPSLILILLASVLGTAAHASDLCFLSSTPEAFTELRVGTNFTVKHYEADGSLFQNLAIPQIPKSASVTDEKTLEFGVEDDGGHALVCLSSDERSLAYRGLEGYPMTLVQEVPQCDQNSKAFDPKMKCSLRLSTDAWIQAVRISCEDPVEASN